MENFKKNFWHRFYVMLLILPTALIITGKEDFRLLVWLLTAITCGSIFIYSAIGTFVKRSWKQYVAFYSFSFLTILLIYMSNPLREFSYIWFILSPFAVATTFISSLYLMPHQTRKLLPNDWVDILESK